MPVGLGMNDANHESTTADGSLRLHVVTKNVQSIRTEARFNDLLVEIVSYDFDVLFVSETWRDAQEESHTSIGGNRMYLSGGLAHQVGVILGNTFHSQLRDISFHPYSPRICVLKCRFGMLNFFPPHDVEIGIVCTKVEPACPKAAPLGRRETTKPKLISTLTTSASKIQ